jgi:hypothetical protein
MSLIVALRFSVPFLKFDPMEEMRVRKIRRVYDVQNMRAHCSAKGKG